MTNTVRIGTPCHPDVPIHVTMVTRGGYGAYDEADGFECMATGCYNAWDKDGNPI